MVESERLDFLLLSTWVRNHWHVSVKRDGVGYFPSRDGINLDLTKSVSLYFIQSQWESPDTIQNGRRV